MICKAKSREAYESTSWLGGTKIDITSEVGHAVVIGGSMAGMLAARVLADHFERVTLLERDPCPSGPMAPPGLAQARHIHVLLEAGRRVLDQLFPSLVKSLIEAGAEQYDGVADFEWISPAGLNPRFPSKIRMLGATRDLIDWGIREQLQEIDRIHMQTANATGLLLDAGNSRVVGGTAICTTATKRASMNGGSPAAIR